MVVVTYGSIDVFKLILALSEADINHYCGPNKSTILHHAASGGSVNVVDVVKLLLLVFLFESNGFDGFSIGKLGLRVSTTTSNSNSPPLSSSPENGSPSSASDSTSSPMIKSLKSMLFFPLFLVLF
uniref:Uncharacterized protein n=1 Tax=Nelumbo nucifera TaxID=4432 RepID=A0A822XZ96_NELNU|nr:TPA_asm: hypothetical protein HUJ06_024171 [Nelumbo nucifera]